MEEFDKGRVENPDRMRDFRVICARCGRTQTFCISEKYGHPYTSVWERAWDMFSSYGWRSIQVSYSTEDAIIGDTYYFCAAHFPNSFDDTMLVFLNQYLAI